MFCLQAEVFDKFLHGSTLEECYSAVASVANRWLDLLDVSDLYNELYSYSLKPQQANQLMLSVNTIKLFFCYRIKELILLIVNCLISSRSRAQ
jgi:hypothetical protein